MSKVLVVHGYYDEQGEYGKVLETVKAQLAQNGLSGDDVEVINPFTFCKNQFAVNEFKYPKDTATWYRGFRTEYHQQLIKEQQAKILEADLLVFYFPIWWEAQPPLMQQWVSDVFRAESFKTIDGKPVAKWGGDKKAMVITTSGFATDVKDENYVNMLKAHGLEDVAKTLPQETLRKLMNMSEGYQLTTALTYAGIPISTQVHVNNVQSGSDQHLVEAITKGVSKLVEKETLIEESMPLLLSGGPDKANVESLKQEQTDKSKQTTLSM